jgi:hypothetical protein
VVVVIVEAVVVLSFSDHIIPSLTTINFAHCHDSSHGALDLSLFSEKDARKLRITARKQMFDLQIYGSQTTAQ